MSLRAVSMWHFHPWGTAAPPLPRAACASAWQPCQWSPIHLLLLLTKSTSVCTGWKAFQGLSADLCLLTLTAAWAGSLWAVTVPVPSAVQCWGVLREHSSSPCLLQPLQGPCQACPVFMETTFLSNVNSWNSNKSPCRGPSVLVHKSWLWYLYLLDLLQFCRTWGSCNTIRSSDLSDWPSKTFSELTGDRNVQCS